MYPMSWTLRLAVALSLATTLAACTQIGNKLNPKDPVNQLRTTVATGGSTSPSSNPLLVPPGFDKQQVAPN